jgi:hypothetical protein
MKQKWKKNKQHCPLFWQTTILACAASAHGLAGWPNWPLPLARLARVHGHGHHAVGAGGGAATDDGGGDLVMIGR